MLRTKLKKRIKMSDYFTEIFDNKTIFETKEELDKLNEKLRAGSWNENQYNEAKTISKLDDSQKNNIISEICAFLNSSEGRGHIYLGIEAKDEKFTEIKPIDSKIITGESHLRDIIRGNLGIFPKEYICPQITINTINFPNGNLFILNVENVDNTVVYYSKITDYIYQRHGHSCIRLSLKEELSIIESKKVAKVFIKIDSKGHIDFYNAGIVPAKRITSVITITKDQTLGLNIVGHSVRKLSNSDSEQQIFQIDIGNSVGNILVYPEVLTNIAKLSVSGNGFFEMDIITYEENGYSKQKMSFDFYDEELQLQDKDIKEDYFTYI